MDIVDTLRRQLGQVEEARAGARAGLVLDPTFTIRRFRDRDVSDNPTFLKQCQNIYEGMRKAGVPRSIIARAASPRSSPPMSSAT